jgi:two-component system, OmpR family, sensor histidine kinase KdpD
MSRGTLRIYLGAAPGVGKTYAMLNEGWRRAQRGTDLVVGFVETHGRPTTAAQLRELEVVSRKRVTYRGTDFEEMDVDAILERKPSVALIDELAHTNVPGSRNEKRWQDVEELLEAGINVVSTVNVQHLESMNDVVSEITGIEQQETIPDAVVRSADQIELVDMTPEALRRRMAHGNIYAPEKVDAALANYFRPGNLGALRELALMWVADHADDALQAYRVAHGIGAPWETRERVVVALTGAPRGDDVIRRASRVAMRSHGELIGVHVRSADGLVGADASGLADQRQLITELGGEYREVAGGNVADALVQCARAENATQIVLGASRRPRWSELLRGSVINSVIRASGPIDVHVISPESAVSDEADIRLRRSRPAILISRRRRVAAWSIALAGPLALTLVLAQLRDTFALPSELLAFLLIVVVVAALGGFVPAAGCAVLGFLLVNWFFTPPFYTFTINEAENLLALVIFLVVAGVVGALVSVAGRRTAEAQRARAEAETLAALGGTLAALDDPLPELVAQLRAAFDLDVVAVLHRGDAAWTVEASAGTPVPTTPEECDLRIPLQERNVLVFSGEGIRQEDLTVLHSFAGQLRLAVERRQLQANAQRAEHLEEANELRTALLAAVSHDLRTPLSSIKASVTSLLQRDVVWTQHAVHEFLETIDEETDRLNNLVGNLLDMSRLQTGALQLVLRDVGLEEIVPGALGSLAERGEPVAIDVPETLARVRVDAALLERAIANLVDNALAWSPDDVEVRVEAAEVGDHVELRVVDRGPGIAPEDRARVFQPFQRLGDRSNGTGVGLGLAVARGFVQAMHGTILLDDTPGGGATMVVQLPKAPV